MNLESLSNELLLDLFEYVSIAHLLRAFHDLNARFDSLLITHFRLVGHLDFRYVYKEDFDIICHQHLPSIINRIRSIRLSNDNDTPEQINLFLSRGFVFHQFTQLSSLSLCHLYSNETIIRIIDQLHDVPHLTCLKFIECQFENNSTLCEKIINNIWSLSKLIRCYWNIITPNFKQSFANLSVTSSSLEYLSIEQCVFDTHVLDNLFQHTPNLQSLRFLRMNSMCDDSTSQHLLSPVPSIMTLNLDAEYSIDKFSNLLSNMPNLKRLTVKISTIDLNGQRWEQIITDQLSNLRIFQMEMAGQFSLDDSIVEMREQLIDSFRTPFWIEQRQWFIRCHWESLIESRSVWLYTLPYAFDDFDIQNKPSKSTCPHENDYWSYNHVRHLIYQFPMIEESSTHQICCPNIDRLSLDLPVTNCFWSLIPTLNRVISMKISLKRDNDKVRSQLQSMFDQTPRLYSLRLDLWRSSKIKIIENLNVSVHQLKIRGTTPSFDIRWFDDEECTSLGHSPLGMQCHMLHIRVAHRGCILKLINLMINLRVLYVKCQDDKPNEVSENLSTTDDIVEWLKYNLSAKWNVSRHTFFKDCIQIWIC